METRVDYDPEFSQVPTPLPELPKNISQKVAAKTPSERVAEWRKNNPERYRAYQRAYMKQYSAKKKAPNIIVQP